MFAHRILVVEDTVELASLVADNLREIVKEVIVCGDGRAALRTLERERVDLVVLDVMLPELGGLEVCRALRAAGNTVPILMLSARSTELDRIVGIEFGADDYMVKPFSMLELLARVKALFRRCDLQAASVPAQNNRLMVADLSIDQVSREVLRDGKPIPLTEKEFDLICVFANNPGRVFSRSQLLDLVWGSGTGVYEGTVTSHINRLRARIEPDPANPSIIQTVWGVGYRLHAPLRS
ncbi:MAG: response regulator transcription factor [Sterolibacterium sp.]